MTCRKKLEKTPSFNELTSGQPKEKSIDEKWYAMGLQYSCRYAIPWAAPIAIIILVSQSITGLCPPMDISTIIYQISDKRYMI